MSISDFALQKLKTVSLHLSAIFIFTCHIETNWYEWIYSQQKKIFFINTNWETNPSNKQNPKPTPLCFWLYQMQEGCLSGRHNAEMTELGRSQVQKAAVQCCCCHGISPLLVQAQKNVWQNCWCCCLFTVLEQVLQKWEEFTNHNMISLGCCF